MARERGVYPFTIDDFHDDPEGYEFTHDGPGLNAQIKYDAAKVSHDYFVDFKAFLIKQGLWNKIKASPRERKSKTRSRAKTR
jgi:hypothetical protein